MEVKHYHRSPRISRSMLMDTVSARISGGSVSGDALIEISDLEKGKKPNNNNNIENHVGGSDSDPAMLTVTSLESYQSKDSSVLENGSYDLSNNASNVSLHRRKNCRFIKKSGHCNVSHAHLRDKPQRFMADIFTTCVDLRWRWNLLLFSTAFIASWLIFGLVYWIIAFAHGDFEELEENRPNRTCVGNLDPLASFTSAFLFSLETQTTIGYGFRVITEECPIAILMVVVQSVYGCVIDAFMIGLIMAKISRPKKRAETLLFSQKAVINVRDGKLCLMVRVGNLRKSHLVEATIRMQYLYSRTTLEGEFIPLEQIDLHLDLKNDSDRLFLVTPQTICHPIDENSPLYNITKNSLRTSSFEIIAILEGMVEATGMTTQARASYLPHEIQWGHRFENVISFSSTNGYHVNFKKFDTTYPSADAPTCSAAELANPELMITNGPTDSVKRRNTSGSTKMFREDSSISDGRDSGYTPVEEEDDSTKTLERTPSTAKRPGSTSSTGSAETKRQGWVKIRQKEKDEGRKTEEPVNDTVFLTTEEANFNRKKRKSQEIAAQIMQEKNLKNTTMSASTSETVEKYPPKMTPSKSSPAEIFCVEQKPEIIIETPKTDNAKPEKNESKAAPQREISKENMMAIQPVEETSDENLSLIENRSPNKEIPIVCVLEASPKGTPHEDSPV